MHMAAKIGRSKPVPVSDLASAILDPVLRKRAGVSIGLVQSWEEIAGPRLSAHTRPERIAWPRRIDEDDPFQPATLVIACEGFAALAVQHETGEIIGRVNAFLGFNAVGRIRILQKHVSAPSKPVRAAPSPLSRQQASALQGRLEPIEDAALRAALERLGRSVLGQKRGKMP